MPDPSPAPRASSSWLHTETLDDHRTADSQVAAPIRSRAALAGLLLGWHEVWCDVRNAALSDESSPVARRELLVPSASAVAALGIDLDSIDRPVLGLSAVRPPRSELGPLLADPGTAWGVAYVLLGSRLRNVAMVDRARALLELPDACCPAFFTPHVAHVERDWDAFRFRLDAAALDHAAPSGAVTAARWTLRWMSGVLEGRLAALTEPAAA